MAVSSLSTVSYELDPKSLGWMAVFRKSYVWSQTGGKLRLLMVRVIILTSNMSKIKMLNFRITPPEM